LTNTHIKKSRHKCAQKQKMLASTVQFSTTTRTEAAPHPQAKPAPTVPEKTTTQSNQARCPLRTQQCAAPARPTTSPTGDVRCFHNFSSNPLPHPDPQRAGEGTRALHHHGRGHRTLACEHHDHDDVR